MGFNSGFKGLIIIPKYKSPITYHTPLTQAASYIFSKKNSIPFMALDVFQNSSQQLAAELFFCILLCQIS